MTRAEDLPNTGSQTANAHKPSEAVQRYRDFKDAFGTLPPPADAHRVVTTETEVSDDIVQDTVRRIRKEGDRDG